MFQICLSDFYGKTRAQSFGLNFYWVKPTVSGLQARILTEGLRVCVKTLNQLMSFEWPVTRGSYIKSDPSFTLARN